MAAVHIKQNKVYPFVAQITANNDELYGKYIVQFCQSGVSIVTEQLNVVTVSNGKRKKKGKITFFILSTVMAKQRIS